MYKAGFEEPAIFWALGKSQLKEGPELILELLRGMKGRLGEETAFQASSALQRFTGREGFHFKQSVLDEIRSRAEQPARVGSQRVLEVREWILRDLERRGG